MPPETISEKDPEYIVSYGEEFVCSDEALGRLWGSFGEAPRRSRELRGTPGKLWEPLRELRGSSKKLCASFWGRSREALGSWGEAQRKL